MWIVFACEKFSDYIYGQRFNIYNDDMPLKGIFNKPLLKAPARIQLFLLLLQQYNFYMHYVKGKLLYVPDTLSRTSLPERDLESYGHSITSNMPISESRSLEFQEETKKDKVLQTLSHQIMKGWLLNRNEVDESIRPYFNIRDELTIHEGIVMRGNRIIVPINMRKEMKQLLHKGHIGITKITAIAQETLYWPGISSMFKDLVSPCSSCKEYQNKQSIETLSHHDIPNIPWTKMGTDMFHLFNKEYLIVVDYTTNYFDTSFLPDTESKTVVKHTKNIFAKYGIPKKTFSENGPEFASRRYKQFCKKNDISHDTSSPEHSNSNGLVERTIQTVKQTLRKAKRSNNDVHLALRALKSTPGIKNQPSPACMFFNRNIGTVVPSITGNTGLKKNYFQLPKSSPGRDLIPLKSEDSVRFRGKGDKTWSRKGSVLERLSQPRSWKVLIDKGTVLRRSRKSLLCTYKYQNLSIQTTLVQIEYHTHSYLRDKFMLRTIHLRLY